jgi:hypothetical protein
MRDEVHAASGEEEAPVGEHDFFRNALPVDVRHVAAAVKEEFDVTRIRAPVSVCPLALKVCCST